MFVINGAINIETLEPTTGFYDTINADSTIALFSKVETKHPNLFRREVELGITTVYCIPYTRQEN